VDIVTTGTFSPMCSSGAFINFGHPSPRIKAHRVWLNDVPAYAGLAAVDCYIGATEVIEGDPLNSVYPGEFNYGGGHVIEDLVAGNVIRLRAEGYGTDCYPARKFEKNITLHDLVNAFLFNPRNAYQNYNCAVNLSDKTIYTYMGMLRPRLANANYATAGQLSPLFNDPYYRTIGLARRSFSAVGRGLSPGRVPSIIPTCREGRTAFRKAEPVPLPSSVTSSRLSPQWLVGASVQGYGVSLFVGIGIPIPILDEEIGPVYGG